MAHRFLVFIITIFVFAAFAPAQSAGYTDKAERIRANSFTTWIYTPIVLDAVRAQNEKHANLTEEEILALDQKWREGDKELINSVLENELSYYLRDVKNSHPELYTEIFVIDSKGLNVGQSDITSDYWQGDENKWLETYEGGPDSMHISHIEDDESSKTSQLQVSLPILDNGIVIGAVTIGLNAKMLQ